MAGVRARSSAVEHYGDIVGVVGSKPSAPTIFFKGLCGEAGIFAFSGKQQVSVRADFRTKRGIAGLDR